MSNTIELMCGPSNNEKLLSVSIPENNDPTNRILVGFTGGLDSSFLLYLLAKLNSTQTIPYIIQPITIDSSRGAADTVIIEQWDLIPKILDIINKKTNAKMFNMMISGYPLLPNYLQIPKAYQTTLDASRYNKFLFLGTTAHIPILPVGYARNFNKPDERYMYPFKDLNKSHIIDAMIKLNLEDLIAITPRCTLIHKYSNEACHNFFCTERRWAYSILNRPDLLNNFISKDT